MEELKELIQMNFDGESLTDVQYSKVAKYWKDLHSLVSACPQIVGKGCLQYIANKVEETATADNRRRKRNPVYNINIKVFGQFTCNYAFEHRDDLLNWLSIDYRKLRKSFKDLKYSSEILDGLQVGEKCHVHGDGDEEYTIISTFLYEPNRPGFVLSNGCSEEVGKCYRVKG